MEKTLVAPTWLMEMGKQADKELSALPVTSQPTWYRLNVTEKREGYTGPFVQRSRR